MGDAIKLPTDSLGDNVLYPAFSFRNMPLTLVTSSGEGVFAPEGYTYIQVSTSAGPGVGYFSSGSGPSAGGQVLQQRVRSSSRGSGPPAGGRVLQ